MVVWRQAGEKVVGKIGDRGGVDGEFGHRELGGGEAQGSRIDLGREVGQQGLVRRRNVGEVRSHDVRIVILQDLRGRCHGALRSLNDRPPTAIQQIILSYLLYGAQALDRNAGKSNQATATALGGAEEATP